MTSLRSPTLGRPLSFPHPRQEDTHLSDSSVNNSSQLASKNEFTSMPLRDESSSARDTVDNPSTRNTVINAHSLANTFGTTEIPVRSQNVTTPTSQQSLSGNMTPSLPSSGSMAQHDSADLGAQHDVQYIAEPASVPKNPQSEIPAKQSTGSRPSSSEETVHNRSFSSAGPTDQSNLHDPNDKRLVKAGILASSAAGAGTAARHLLVARDGTIGEEGGREPRGYQGVSVPDKWGIGSKNIKEARWKAIKKGAFLFGFITLWLWICLSIFWGSTYRLTSFLPSLTVHVIPLDTPSSTSYLNGPITEQMQTVANQPPSIVHLGYQMQDPSNYPNGLEDVRRSVIAQDCWAAIVINANASSAWTNALNNGDASYDPNGAIGIYYSSARFYQVVLLYFDSLITRDLASPLATARSQALQAFIGTTNTNTNALTNAAIVPQAIGVGFGYTIFDVRPIQNSAWAGAAPMEASLIYFIIFAFYICLFGGMARMKSGLQSRLKMSSMFALRLGWPLLAYFFISLWETLIIRAWQVPLTDYLGRAGFVTLWALNYITIIACGLAMETVLAIVGMAWLPFFLILWIILNITSSFYPIEMMPNFYRFLRWMPFVHNVEAYKIIAFGTNLQHRLGLHFGIIFAVIGVELICFPLALLFERWNSDKSQRKQIEQKKQEENDNKHHQNGERGDEEA
ncbi:uncharacterized protein I206_106614 [Kwoniella pini CBS 10737]|uniref:DUF3533 domain-containing protein n=1 Tax=Kwoniella pini CBS 10737 TaxID=1296096 RepID=A0A1B9HTP3_9TREE|nr:uncharacterized protein I206_07495 [Kwoniella pini CBS 10737]OCF46642.1 hypothetical protein I206_07495 [Kwoniella pini CBS 10737]